jgi:hypothetical protein
MVKKIGGITLQNDEAILHDLRPKWAAWLWPIVLTFGFYIPIAWLKRRRTRYIITDRRAILKRGSWSTSHTEEFQLSDVTRLRTNQSLGEKLIGGGTLVLDVGVDELRLTAVPDHSEVAASIRGAQTE